MADIIWSICAIGLIILIGWFLRRRAVIGPDAAKTLSALCYWVASPAMLFHAVASTDVARVLGRPLWVAAASGIGSALVFIIVAGGIMGLRRGDLVLGAMSSSLNNAAYIGIPIAVYVLGDASRVVPVLVFQLGFFTPMFFVLADLAGSERAPTPRLVATTVATNPMVVAAAAGFVFSWFELPVPRVVDVAAGMLGEAAPPMILLAFGASLVGQGFSMRTAGGGAIVVASLAKLVVQPLVACSVGALIGMTGIDLMAVTIMAGMPTAQNAFIAATRAGTGERIAQGTVLVTTFASLPLTIATAWAFHALAGV